MRTISGKRAQDAFDEALRQSIMEDNRRGERADKLVREQEPEIARLESLFEEGKSSLGHEKAVRVFAQIQAIVAIEQLKEIHKMRVERILNGGMC